MTTRTTRNGNNSNSNNSNRNSTSSAIVKKSNNSSAPTNGKELAEARRLRFHRKRERTEARSEEERRRKKWIAANGHCCVWMEADDVERIRERRYNKRRNHGVGGGGGDETNSSITATNSTEQQGEGSNREDYQLHESGKWLAKLERQIEPYLDLKDTIPPCPINDTGNEQNRNNAADPSKGERLFIAEGTETVRLLIQHCAASQTATKNDTMGTVDDGIRIVSVMSKPAAFFDGPLGLSSDIERFFPSMATNTTLLPTPSTMSAPSKVSKTSTLSTISTSSTISTTSPPFDILLGSQETLSRVVGFPLSRGALATGVVPHRNESWLYSYLSRLTHPSTASSSSSTTVTEPTTSPSAPPPSPTIRILAIDRISDAANLGSILRTAAAFGTTVVVLSNDSCDAWYRRCVRVSMGHVVSVPSVRVEDLATTLEVLRERFRIGCYAAVVKSGDVDKDCIVNNRSGCGIDGDNIGAYGNSKCSVDCASESKSKSTLVLENMAKGNIAERWCCVMGNEANGISNKVLAACQYQITIGMVNGVDSLSVGVATGILLHGMRERE